jgi:DNA-directed RNA polymerase specialized sigma24 family protein
MSFDPCQTSVTAKPGLTALRRLPARQREVIALRVFLDLDIDTTARHLGIAPGTVRAHLSRAMTALRSELAPATPTEIKTAETMEIKR